MSKSFSTDRRFLLYDSDMGPRFRVSSERLEKPGIEPTTPGLEGEQLNHYATEASEIWG